MDKQQTQIGIKRLRADDTESRSVLSKGESGTLRRIDFPSARDALSIALIRQSFRLDGGGERIVSQINRVLQQNGFDVTLIARKWNGIEAQVLKCDPAHWNRIQREVRFAQEAIRLTQQHDFNLVQSHERIPGSQIYRAGDGVHRCWLEQRYRSLPTWRKILLDRSRFHRYLLEAERLMFEHPSLQAVICNSRMVAAEIASHFRIDPEKLRVIYNGIDTHRFHPYLKQRREEICERYRLPVESPLALFVGSGWERKGLGQVLAALPHVKHVSLLVVGRDKSGKRFQRITRSLGLADRVRFAGVQEDVTPFYGAADLFVLPTLYDPFPNAVMEAMACGLPIVTSQKCGGAELIVQCENGLIVDALDTKAIANSLDYCSDRQRCLEMGVQARGTVEACSLEQMQREYSNLYRSLLEDGSA